jgi:hypothetical protein
MPSSSESAASKLSVSTGESEAVLAGVLFVIVFQRFLKSRFDENLNQLQ